MEPTNKLGRTLLGGGLALLLGFTPAGPAAAQTVTGDTSGVSEGGFPRIGIVGPGTLLIEGGNTLSTAGSHIGEAIGGAGVVVVRGSGSEWNDGDSLFVGFEGTGSLVIDDSAVVSITDEAVAIGDGFTVIGGLAGSTGLVTVKNGGQFVVPGPGILEVGGGFVFPDAGVPGATTFGTLNVLSGGTVNAVKVLIARTENSIGTVQVADYPSMISVDETVGSDFGDGMAIGHIGDARLTIRNGGRVNAGSYVSIGRLPGTTSIVTVDGVAQVDEGGVLVDKPSTFTSRGVDESYGNAGAFVLIGRAGTGLFNITRGGQFLIDAETLDPGDVSGFGLGGGGGSTAGIGGERTGILLVSGANSSLTVAGGLGFFQIGKDDGAIGIMNITEGGRVALLNPDNRSVGLIARKSGSTGIVLVDGVDGMGVPSELEAGRLLGCDKESDFTTDPLPDETNLLDPGGVGSITVRNGGVVGADIIVIGPDCTVSGDGTLDARVKLVNEGTISPGLSPGTLTINGSYEQTATGKLFMEIGPDASDQLLIGGSATLAGVINLLIGKDVKNMDANVIVAESITGDPLISIDGSEPVPLGQVSGLSLDGGVLTVSVKGGKVKTKTKTKTKGGG